MKAYIILGAIIAVLLVLIGGYWLGTADFTDELNLEEKQEEESKDENSTDERNI